MNKIVEQVKKHGYSVRVSPHLRWSYLDRERLKEEAWAMVASDEPLHARASALMLVIQAHHWRAIEHLEGCSKQFQRQVQGKRYRPGCRLDFDLYVRNWLWASGPSSQEQDVLRYVVDEMGYQPERNRFMPHGASYYGDEPVIAVSEPFGPFARLATVALPSQPAARPSEKRGFTC
jgi:hypothetical protein